MGPWGARRRRTPQAVCQHRPKARQHKTKTTKNRNNEKTTNKEAAETKTDRKENNANDPATAPNVSGNQRKQTNRKTNQRNTPAESEAEWTFTSTSIGSIQATKLISALTGQTESNHRPLWLPITGKFVTGKTWTTKKTKCLVDSGATQTIINSATLPANTPLRSAKEPRHFTAANGKSLIGGTHTCQIKFRIHAENEPDTHACMTAYVADLGDIPMLMGYGTIVALKLSIHLPPIACGKPEATG